jgi:hypothetical protein
MRHASALLLLLAAGFTAFAADPPQVKVARTVRSDPSPGVPVMVPQGRFYPIDLTDSKPVTFDTDETIVRIVTLKAGERLINQTKYDEAADAVPADYEFPDAKNGVALIFARKGSGTAQVKSYVNGEGNNPPVKGPTVLIQCVGKKAPTPDPTPTPDPGPPTPDPKPPSPVPTGIRVLFVKDSTKTLPAPQSSIPDAAAIQTWLKTTQGWRTIEPTATTLDDATLTQVWAAAKPKVTTTPCIVIQYGSKIDILPWPADAPTAVTTLKAYQGK